jgi:hypothetical protein
MNTFYKKKSQFANREEKGCDINLETVMNVNLICLHYSQAFGMITKKHSWTDKMDKIEI